MSLIDELLIGRDDWRTQLIRNENDVMQRLSRSYARTLETIKPELDRLQLAMEAAENAGAKLTAEELRRLPQLTTLRNRLTFEMDRFGVLATSEAANASQDAALIGANAAETMSIRAAGQLGRVVQSQWLRPDPDALRRLAGFVDSEAFNARWSKFGENVANDFADSLIALQAQGRGYRAAARFIAGRLNLPLAWVDNAVRTTSIWSARTATHASYRQNSAIVMGWVWWATLDTRTCLSCVSKHGTEYTNDEVLNDHHRGRCVALPRVRGTTWQAQSGPEWFNTLSEQRQLQQGGAPKEMVQGLRNGSIGWGEVSHTYNNDVFGEMVRTATLGELKR